jgi:hypothetical protein
MIVMAGLTRHPTSSSEILFFHKPKTQRHGGLAPPSYNPLRNPIFIITSNMIVMAGLTRHPAKSSEILFFHKPKTQRHGGPDPPPCKLFRNLIFS